MSPGFLGDHNVRFKIPRDITSLYRARCPKCGSLKVPVYKSETIEQPDDTRVQYRKCEDCKHNFQTTVE